MFDEGMEYVRTNLYFFSFPSVATRTYQPSQRVCQVLARPVIFKLARYENHFAQKFMVLSQSRGRMMFSVDFHNQTLMENVS